MAAATFESLYSLLPTLMAAMENDSQKLHFSITCMYYAWFSIEMTPQADFVADVNSENLPTISKKTPLKTIARRLYALLSIDDCPGVDYEIPSLDLKEHNVGCQMILLAIWHLLLQRLFDSILA